MGGMDINRRTRKNSPGRRVTVKEVAAELGISPSTVSNAYNRPDQLSAELRERVFEAARRLGYAGPNPLGRSLRRRRADAVGVLFRDRLSYAFADPGVVLFLEGVSEAVEEAGLGLLLLPGGSLGSRDPEAIRGAAVDGVVIHAMAADDPLVGAALERGFPTVLVDQPPVEGVPSVGIDDEGAARAAAEHLIELGHRRLGVVSLRLGLDATSGLAGPEHRRGATLRPSAARLRGYASAVEAAGISWDEVPVYECAESTPAEGRVAAWALLSREPRPTAILAMLDQLAFGIVEAATEMGLSVPEDLSVVGFDDVPEAARSNPPLTTVSQPHVEKGLYAGRKLVAQLREEDPGRSEELLLPTKLLVRGSTTRAS
jgi:DNA-binding LacI/PurR family transcriptional regulator